MIQADRGVAVTTARPGAEPPDVLTDDASIEAFVPEWRAFSAKAARSPFESPDWLLPWYRHYGHRARPRVLVWRAGGEVVGVAPLVVTRSRRGTTLTELALWAGFGPALRGLVDVVATDEHRAGVEASFAAWLATGPQRWDLLNLLRLPAGSTTPATITDAGETGGWRSVDLSGSVRSETWVIELPADLDGWARHLGAKARHNMRTEARRLERAGGTWEQSTDPALVEDVVAALRRLMAERWGAAEVDFAPDPAFEPFLIDAFRAMLAAGAMWFDLARDASGAIRACLVTFALNGRAVAVLMGVSYAEDVRKMSLGKQLFDRSASEAIRRGCGTYDFLWVGGYKESFWHASPRYLHSVVIGRGMRGLSAAGYVALRRVIVPRLLGRVRRRTAGDDATNGAHE